MKKVISVCLAVLMLLAAIPLIGFTDVSVNNFALKARAYSVGETIQYGTYPQSRVTDNDTLAQPSANLDSSAC